MADAIAGNQQHGAETGVDGPLGWLTVIDLSTTPAGAFATQFLADAGADVIQVEPPGGSAMRAQAAWPALGRGKRSVVLDINDPTGREVLFGLVPCADVLVTTLRPKTSRRLGLSADDLAALNPRLVSAAITGWGSSGPWVDLKGYEGMVMAKLGHFHAKRRIFDRQGPAFLSAPYASWGAAHTALQGIMAALIERDSSGRGQHVEADMVRGVSTLDTWAWFTDMVSLRWPGAYESAEAFSESGEVQAPLIYPLLGAPTSDGYWLQFSQTEPRLFRAMLEEFGMASMLEDPKWKGIPFLESQELRTELWETMIRKVGERSLAEWQHVFDTNPNVSAEVFRAGPEALDHPQIVHDRRKVVGQDPGRGAVRQPSTLVHSDNEPLSAPAPAPGLDEHGARVRQGLPTLVAPAGSDTAPSELPLAGVTILELGLMFAAPFGSTMLTELGARVIKVESLDGDTIRRVVAFPEAGAAKVMQGKESISLDLRTDEGRRIVHELARRSDVVLQAFRAGAAERAGVDPETLHVVNPDLIYLNAPGYGTDGPYGHRPAYALSIAAAAGLALADAPDAASKTGSLAEIKNAAMRLNQATGVPTLQADGIAALAVASAMLLGVLARAHDRPLGTLTTTMLASTTHALVDTVIDYPGRPASPTVDSGGHGYSALYRMYEAADGWVFLAAPADREWPSLATALAGAIDLDGDVRFASAQARRDNDTALADALAGVFRTRKAAEWERDLTEADVGCVVVTEEPPTLRLQTDETLAAEYATTAASPTFSEHLRMGPAVRFSRSGTQTKGGCLAGDDTDAMLAELGYGDGAIADLRSRNIVS